MERGVPRDQFDVLLGGAELERDGVGRKQPDDVEQQASWKHDNPFARDLCLQWDPKTHVHVGGLELAAARGRTELNA